MARVVTAGELLDGHLVLDIECLQAICDRLQPGTIEVFAQRWLHRLPMPFGRKDQARALSRQISRGHYCVT